METHTSIKAPVKVLYLSEWYPNMYDNASGRFVRAHATAAHKQGVDICVLVLIKAQNPQDVCQFTQHTHGVKEIYVYYTGNYIHALRKGWRLVQQEWGKPDLCQLNVITKNALLPLYLLFRYKIPYLIVEHWTGYYPQNGGYKGFLRKSLTRLAAKYATTILTVSTNLRDRMLQHKLHNKHYQTINNIVDDIYFTPQPRANDNIKRILHVSFYDDGHKNESGIIRAIKQVSDQRKDFQIVMIGDGKDYEKVQALAQTLAIPTEQIVWYRELPPTEVCHWFYQSDFFVFFSNYETAGIVLSESLAAGKPIISTPVGIAPDVVTPETGLLVPIGNETALAESINHMLDHYQDYDSNLIKKQSEPFRNDNVGQKLVQIYHDIIQHT